jgi:hypothetical protein
MNSFNQPGYSYNEPDVQSSIGNPNQQSPGQRMNKSFIDNKPMIQGLVRSVLKV